MTAFNMAVSYMALPIASAFCELLGKTAVRGGPELSSSSAIPHSDSTCIPWGFEVPYLCRHALSDFTTLPPRLAVRKVQ